jgi:hypothetical protein
LDIRLLFAYAVQFFSAHRGIVSFTDTNNIRHGVEVATTTLYEAAPPLVAGCPNSFFTGPPRRFQKYLST